jgi:acetoin:2,6-dichlorophenolindophenol oxidoreductase subunit alpha
MSVYPARTSLVPLPQLGPDPVRTGPDDDDLAVLLLIRHFERALLDLFARGEVDGTTHTCLGQEYIPVALRPLLTDTDFVFSNHRGHGHYLACFDDPIGLLAEIMGRAGAVCAGVGGSQHLRRGRYLSTGVQGESVPVAAGAALHLARHEPGGLACVYVGDGTWGQGVVYEALNLAALWRLPLLVVVEHNGIAQSTPTGSHLAGTIAGRAAAFGVAHLGVATDEVDDVRSLLAAPVAALRSGAGPLVVEFATRRLGPHSKGDDVRPPELLARLRAEDWYPRYAATLGPRFARIDAAQRSRVADVVREVSARPLSAWSPPSPVTGPTPPSGSGTPSGEVPW